MISAYYNATYSYNSIGKLKRITQQWSDSKSVYKFKYDSSGRLASKSLISTFGGENPWSVGSKETNIKYNDNGYIKSLKYTNVGATDSHASYRVRYKYTYKNSRVMTRTAQIKFDGGKWTPSGTASTYNYKKIQVPASLVKKIKAQQNDIINGRPMAIEVVTAQA